MKQRMQVYEESRRTEFVRPIQADVTFTPGAKISTIFPKLENEARSSSMVLAATVTALGSRAGEVFPASSLEFPAATATWTPAVVRLRTASSRAWSADPPSDILTTEGLLSFSHCSLTQLRPATLSRDAVRRFEIQLRNFTYH